MAPTSVLAMRRHPEFKDLKMMIYPPKYARLSLRSQAAILPPWWSAG
jgi:hypothetical protein